MSGYLLWTNPFGHLSIEALPNYYVYTSQCFFIISNPQLLPQFYLGLSVCYLFVAIGWFALSAKHWDRLLGLQNCIAGVIALGMIEATVLYFTYLIFNQKGEKCTAFLILCYILSYF